MTNCIKPPGRVLTSQGWKDVSCKMRNCPVCSKVLRNQLMDRVKAFFLDDQLYFNTITMQSDDKSNIMKHWHTLIRRLNRYYKGLRIFWVKEYTKRHTAHLHFLTTQALDGSWLSRAWLEITGTSYVVKCGNTTGEIRNAAGYMLKYMTKAHGNLDLYDKGERIYGFLGAKAPPVQKLGFNEDPLEFVLEQHYNTGSAYWQEWYNAMQLWIGPAFINYIEYHTLSIIDKVKVEQSLTSESPNVEPIFTRVELYDERNNKGTNNKHESDGLVERNRDRLKAWRHVLESSPGPDELCPTRSGR